VGLEKPIKIINNCRKNNKNNRVHEEGDQGWAFKSQKMFVGNSEKITTSDGHALFRDKDRKRPALKMGRDGRGNTAK